MCDDGKVYRQCQIDGVKKRSIPSRVSNDVDYHVFGPLRIVSSWQKISFLSDSGPVPIQHSQKPASIIIQPVAKQLKPKREITFQSFLGFTSLKNKCNTLLRKTIIFSCNLLVCYSYLFAYS